MKISKTRLPLTRTAILEYLVPGRLYTRENLELRFAATPTHIRLLLKQLVDAGEVRVTQKQSHLTIRYWRPKPPSIAPENVAVPRQLDLMGRPPLKLTPQQRFIQQQIEARRR